MILAKVKSIHSLDVPDLGKYAPEVPGSFGVHVRLLVGPGGSPGEESFDLTVCSPSWLSARCEKDGFVVGRHYFVVTDFNWTHIEKAITKLVERCSGDSWREVAQKVGRIGSWEFEDYNP